MPCAHAARRTGRRRRRRGSGCPCRGFGLPEPLRGDDDGDESEADRIEERLRIDEKETGDDEQSTLPPRAALPEPALEAARDGDDADRRGEGDQGDRAPVRLAEGLEAAGEEQSGTAWIEDEHERHKERRRRVLPALQR